MPGLASQLEAAFQRRSKAFKQWGDLSIESDADGVFVRVRHHPWPTTDLHVQDSGKFILVVRGGTKKNRRVYLELSNERLAPNAPAICKAFEETSRSAMDFGRQDDDGVADEIRKRWASMTISVAD